MQGPDKAPATADHPDRALDPASPVLHEPPSRPWPRLRCPLKMTFHKHETRHRRLVRRSVLLHEDDDLWEVTSCQLKDFSSSKRMNTGEKITMRICPRCQEDASVPEGAQQVLHHLQLAEDRMKYYQGTGTSCAVWSRIYGKVTLSGEKIKILRRAIVPILLDNVSTYDKIRIILLYIFPKNGE
ncbi:syntaxin-binding protein 1 isoform X1 [Lates japonicus]|uniref:Syntaxin-binding protein 1 isoform X1 n=1 Tax=Lates japonicus TaxID=270547 RepID=A0AAD3R6A6_LATJO|nr:syntaxin-binding protein 1 isoform X1 [Lates japonicus]